MPTKTLETYGQRKSLEAVRADLAVLLPMTIADGCDCQQGDVLGEINSSGFGRRRTRTPANGAGFLTTSPSGAVEDASLFKAGDVLKNAAGTTIGTVAVGGINKTTNTITLTANAAVAVAAGAAVLGSDGSQVAKAIADAGSDGVGETTVPVFIEGLLKESYLRGLDSTAKTELGGRSTIGGVFIF